MNRTPDGAIRELETSINDGKTIKPPRTRNLLLGIAEVNIYEVRGFTRDDIKYKNPNDRRGIIYRLKNRGILIPLKRRENRLEQYALANLYDDLVEAMKLDDEVKKEEIKTFEKGLLDELAEIFSSVEPGLHNVHLNTDLLNSDVAEVIYDSLVDWELNSKNKGKLKRFRLSPKRTFVVTIYRTGRIMIDISCSAQSFKLHNPKGLIEFFSTLGEIRRFLITDFQNNSYEIPKPDEWWLTQFDIDSTVSLSDLKKKKKFESINISSSLRNAIQIKMFGHLFYAYIKSMPYMGESFRFEERRFVEKKPIDLSVKEILNSGTPLREPVTSYGDKDSLHEAEESHYEEGREYGPTFTSALNLINKAKRNEKNKQAPDDT